MDTADLERYDAKRHDDDAFVLVELACACGGLFRRADPVHVTRPDAEQWVANHAGEGHAAASMADAIAARSGTPPEAGTEGAADHTDRKVRAWPFDADPDTLEELAAHADATAGDPADQPTEG